MKILQRYKKLITTKTGKTYMRNVADVQCDTCNEFYTTSWKQALLTGICRKCSQTVNNKAKLFNGHKTIGDLTGSLYGEFKSKCKRKNSKRNLSIPFTISQQYLWDLFIKQDRKCALSGLHLTLKTYNKWTSTGKSRHPDGSLVSASIDRIDSRFGYVEGNVQWVHKTVNIMKNCLTDSDFIWMCKKIANNNTLENTEPIFIKDMSKNMIMKKVQRLTGEPNNNPDTSTPQPDVLVEDIV